MDTRPDRGGSKMMYTGKQSRMISRKTTTSDLVAAHVPVNGEFLQSVQLAAAKLSDRSGVAEVPDLQR